MIRTLSQHKGIVLIITIFAAGALWYGMSQSSSEPSSAIVTGGAGETVDATGAIVAGTAADPETQKILDILLALRSVKLDGTIFSNTAFMSLKDMTTKIIPEPAGRPDPFAPLGAGGPLPVRPQSSQTNSTGR